MEPRDGREPSLKLRFPSPPLWLLSPPLRERGGGGNHLIFQAVWWKAATLLLATFTAFRLARFVLLFTVTVVEPAFAVAAAISSLVVRLLLLSKVWPTLL